LVDTDCGGTGAGTFRVTANPVKAASFPVSVDCTDTPIDQDGAHFANTCV